MLFVGAATRSDHRTHVAQDEPDATTALASFSPCDFRMPWADRLSALRLRSRPWAEILEWRRVGGVGTLPLRRRLGGLGHGPAGCAACEIASRIGASAQNLDRLDSALRTEVEDEDQLPGVYQLAAHVARDAGGEIQRESSRPKKTTEIEAASPARTVLVARGKPTRNSIAIAPSEGKPDIGLGGGRQKLIGPDFSPEDCTAGLPVHGRPSKVDVASRGEFTRHSEEPIDSYRRNGL